MADKEIEVDPTSFDFPTTEESYVDVATTNLCKKVLKVMAEVGMVEKDSTNPHFKYKYLSAANLLSKIQPSLVANGLIAAQEMKVVSDNGGRVTVECRLSVIDVESGATIEVVSLGCGIDSGDKAVMKAQTAAHKYAWYHLLNIPTGDDPEADEEVSVPRAKIPAAPVETREKEIFGISTKVMEIKKKSANPKAPWLITTTQGEFETFSDTNATEAELAQATGADFKFEYTIGEYRGQVVRTIVDQKKG